MKYALLACLLVIGGCSSDAEYSPTTAFVRFELADEPFISIPEESSDNVLYRVAGATRLRDGGVVISNAGYNRLDWYDASGGFVSSAGTKGSGPGEFGDFSVMRIYPLGDSLMFVDDAPYRRFHTVRMDGTFMETSYIKGPSFDLGTAWLQDAALVSGQPLVLLTSPIGHFSGEPGEAIASPFFSFTTDGTGAFRDSITVSYGPPRVVNEHQGTIHYPFLPFAGEDLLVLDASSSGLIRLSGQTLHRISLEGQVTDSLVFSNAAPVTDALIDAYRDYALQDVSESRRPLYEALFERSIPYPAYLPFATALFRDANGALWLERYRAPWDTTATTQFEIVGSDFARLGVMDTGIAFDKVFEIGSDYILGRITRGGAPRIVGYEFE